MDTNLKDQLIEKFELGAFSEAEQDQILREISDVVTEAVLSRTIPQLSEEDGINCDELLASDTDMQGILSFIAMNVPNFQQVVDEEIVNVQKSIGAK